MSAAITDYGAGYWAGVLFGINPVPASYYLALATAVPGVGWNGDILATVEPPAAAGYTRQPVAANATTWTLANNYLTLATTIDFGLPTADWGVVSYYALVDAATSGNMYAYGTFLNPSSLSTDIHVRVPAGALTLQLERILPSIVI